MSFSAASSLTSPSHLQALSHQFSLHIWLCSCLLATPGPLRFHQRFIINQFDPSPASWSVFCTWFVGHHNNTDKCTDQSLNMVLQSFPRDFGSYWCGNIVWLYNAHWDPMTLDTIGVKCSNRHKLNCWNSSFGRTLGPWFNLTFQQWKDNFMQTLLLDLINCTEMLLCDWQLDIYLN